MSVGNLYTIPPGLPFLRTLAEAMLAGDLPQRGGPKPSPVSLAGYTLLLPTRRATRALQEAFLAAADGRALLLPKIRPIGEGVEDLSLMAGAAGLGDLGPDSADIPPAMSELQRRLVLTELVLQWSRALRQPSGDPAAYLDDTIAAGANTPAQAAKLATELARLMDMVETEGASLAGLDQLVPEDFSEHWKKTLEFLEIVVAVWPQYLAAHERLSPMDRRNRVLRLEAARLAAMPPAGPVIVAGVTGSIPAAAELMKVVAALPQGAIVLPGLDQSIDDESFALVAKQHPDHPQYGLAKLLGSLGADRRNVAVLGTMQHPAFARSAMLGEALRPAATTDRWHDLARAMTPEDAVAALTGVHAIVTPTAQDEADVAALILRKAIETPGKTAALVSPDRVLARRVGVRLAAMGVQVDDSAGRPFGKTVSGAFLDLAIEAAAQDFAPAATMALLKHPLTRLGMSARDIRRAARYLELGAFRALYLGRGLDGIDQALERAAQEAVGDSDVSVPRARAVRRMWDADWQAARDLVAKLKDAYAPWLAACATDGTHSLQTLAKAHVDVAEALSRHPDDLVDGQSAQTGSDAASAKINQPLWDGEAGLSAQTFFTGLLDPDLRAPALAASDYADFYRGLVAGENVRPRHALHPRVFIWGPFEARLQQPDIIVLGSLNDGTWPEAADPGPWLNRPMRAQLGLPSPEERIGAMAHDFTQLLGAKTVYLTRAEKIGGVPTVPSRWLMRLTALLDGLKAPHALAPDQPWLAWARARDVAGKGTPVAAPAPCPAVKLRPRKLSVTSIERWLANPYAIYAQHVLELEALPPLGMPPDARLRGAIIHDALSRFAKRHPDTLPADIAAALSQEAAGVLETFAAHPRIAAFWRPRFDRFAAWFGETEQARRSGIVKVVAEISGKHVIAAPFAPFTLTARADRFDVSETALAIYDYKTGTPPTKAAVESGQSPQLLLEALIARANGFGTVPALPVTKLTYIRATGGEPPGKETALDIADLDARVARTATGLAALIAAFDDIKTPYRALRRGSLKTAYGFDDFEHLARVDEWSGGEGSTDEQAA
jgi:ATP-dependent helicase/nuclease subunit B